MEIIKVKNILGYGNELAEMRKAKLINTLDKQYRYDGIILHRYEFIINRILEGLKPEFEENYSYYSRKIDGYTKPKTLYKLKSEDNSYYEITKMEYDFATWLINNNITTIEKIKEFELIEDNRVKEIERLEAERVENECQEQLRKEKEEQEFKNWLESESSLYNNTEKLEITKAIYQDEINQCSIDLCKKVLFLIENIDNEGCRKDLMSRLRNYNPASRKVFYHVTGIRLPKTDKATIELLQSISSNEYKGLINYKRKADREEQQKEIVKFYRKNKDGISLAEGEKLKNNYDLQLYVTFDSEKDYYIIVEARTGMTLISGDRNKATLLKTFKERMTDDLVKRVKEQIEYLVNTNGELPKAM